MLNAQKADPEFVLVNFKFPSDSVMPPAELISSGLRTAKLFVGVSGTTSVKARPLAAKSLLPAASFPMIEEKGLFCR